MDNPIFLTLLAIASIPTYLGLMSFIMWENGFRIMGIGWIARLTTVLVVGLWVCITIKKYSGA